MHLDSTKTASYASTRKMTRCKEISYIIA